MGCLTYSGLMNFQLPYSGLKFCFCNSTEENFLKKFESFKGEGKGFFPDFWSESNDIQESLIQITGDNELKEKLKFIKIRQI